MKKIICALMCFLSFSCFAATTSAPLACAKAVAPSNPGFCPSFKSVAACQCVTRGMPATLCNDMGKLHAKMISMFGTIQAACNYQKDTTPQECMDDWSCYLNGGKDSKGAACSATGRKC